MRQYIVVVLEIVIEDVLDKTPQDSDVTPWSDLQMLVGYRRRAGKARIDRDELGTTIVPCLDRPLKAARVVLGRVRTCLLYTSDAADE